MRNASTKATMPKNWVSSPLTRALCAKGLNNSHKVRKAANMSWNQVDSITSGKTLKPHPKTIQKLMAVSGISRQQYGGHTRVVNSLRTEVDKSVVTKATTRMVASKKSKAPAPSGDITLTVTINGDQLRSLLSK